MSHDMSIRLSVEHHFWLLQLGAIKHLPPTARKWHALFSDVDARFLFWLALQCPVYGVAVVEYIYTGRPSFLQQDAGLYTPFPYTVSFLDRLAPELLQEILEHLPLKDLLSFGQTSLRLRGWAAVMFKLRVSELFSPYHVSYDLFRFVQISTGVALSGSIIAHLALYLRGDPNAFVLGDVDIYVPASSWNVVVAFFTVLTGYAVYKERSSSYGTATSITTVIWMRTHPFDPHTLNFMRCIDDNVYGPTVQFHSTCVVGCITAKRAWFPTLDLTTQHITILNRNFNPLRMLEDRRRALAIYRKWRARGFLIRVDYTKPHHCGHHSCCPATIRTSNDKYSYTLALPLGASANSDAFAASPDPAYDIISWTFGGEGCTKIRSGVQIRPYDVNRTFMRFALGPPHNQLN
ncbi:hypothetical protein C8R45DRAFT_1107316 [Mycena sanguinolenta]|nr:hypothetical protein C8R45DRAFT_1107316 [Mycena sanguinolenta]